MDGDRLRLPANRNCYRLSRVSWALLKLLVSTPAVWEFTVKVLDTVVFSTEFAVGNLQLSVHPYRSFNPRRRWLTYEIAQICIVWLCCVIQSTSSRCFVRSGSSGRCCSELRWTWTLREVSLVGSWRTSGLCLPSSSLPATRPTWPRSWSQRKTMTESLALMTPWCVRCYAISERDWKNLLTVCLLLLSCRLLHSCSLTIAVCCIEETFHLIYFEWMNKQINPSAKQWCQQGFECHRSRLGLLSVKLSKTRINVTAINHSTSQSFSR